MAPQSFTLSLQQPATSVPVAAGSTIVVRGSVYSRYDGAVVDAASTTWPASAPGGASLDGGGLVDFAAGGFEIVARDAATHEVRAMATGKDAPACALAHVSAPCLPLRASHLAHSRLLGLDEWLGSLRGELKVDADGVLAGAEAQAGSGWVVAGVPALATAAVAVLVVMVALACRAYRRWAGSARRRFARLVGSIDRAAAKADPVLSKVLGPPLRAARRAVRARQIDPESGEGQRLATALEQLHIGLCAEAARKRLDAERHVADALALEVQTALEAAAELSHFG